MNIMVGGGPYHLLNTATLQRTRLEIHDLFNYRGQTIMYGIKMQSGIWLPGTIGRQDVPEGPACFPLFTGAQAVKVVQLADQLHSLPIFFLLPDQTRLPILSLEDSHKILGGQRGVHDDMIKRAQRLVDLYEEWEPVGILPEWFRLKRDLVKSRN